LVGDCLSDRSWSLAQLSIAQGGLGIRDPSVHAPAAYLSSLALTAELCKKLDRSFDIDDTGGGLRKNLTEGTLRASMLEAAAWQREGKTISQRELSGLVDAASRQRLLDDEQADATFGAHVSLNSISGAGVWLTAPPASDGRHMDVPLFKIELRRRLRIPVFDEEGFCPCCGHALDRFGDHAIACACAGDRTIRHNAVRDAMFKGAHDANLSPEREKAGLLPDRPSDDGLPRTRGRRPADIWFPKGRHNLPEAIDFAVTSGMRADIYRTCRTAPEEVFERYERFKRDYKSTSAACESANFRFVPAVFEAHGGGFSHNVRGLLDWIARETAAWQREPLSVISLQTAQRISIALHRENARAVLKRMPKAAPAAPGGDAWQHPGDLWQ
jgi:hypothetical protein